mgnify:CR=1 FL=1
MHGRWGYRRISQFICYYFYKNIVLVFTELYFPFYNGFSGQMFFPELLPLCYNSFWTSWPCILNYSVEKDADESTSLNHPKLYLAGQKGYYFNMKKFWIWIIFAFIHGILLFFGIMYGLNCSSGSGGQYYDHWYLTTLLFSCTITVVTLRIYVDTFYWNIFNM